ncbi:hypothetical protein, partial [Nocardia abscessus]|uniref:hypothetical protein n=1 Tax=Nocardia abscessus TaxID=120957 RepID=UPI002457825A
PALGGFTWGACPGPNPPPGAPPPPPAPTKTPPGAAGAAPPPPPPPGDDYGVAERSGARTHVVTWP